MRLRCPLTVPSYQHSAPSKKDAIRAVNSPGAYPFSGKPTR